MSKHRKILKIFFVLAIVSLSYTLTSVYLLYKKNSGVFPDFLHGALDAIAPDLTSCYYAENGDNYLRSLASAGNDFIYFHEINCQTTLGLREACSVESIARAHPNRQVIVVFTRALTMENCRVGTLAQLQKLRNVHFFTVDLNSYAHDTPLEIIFLPRDTSLGKWHYRGIGELLKFLTLYKFGGIAVDFNMMVIDSLDKLGDNWVAMRKESWDAGIYATSRDYHGKYFSKRFMVAPTLQLTHTGAVNERSALKEILKAACNTTVAEEMSRPRCKGFQVYTEEFANPGYIDVYEDIGTNSTLGYFWPVSTDQSAPPMNSLYAHLVREYCPIVFGGFKNNQRG